MPTYGNGSLPPVSSSGGAVTRNQWTNNRHPGAPGPMTPGGVVLNSRLIKQYVGTQGASSVSVTLVRRTMYQRTGSRGSA